MVLAALEQPQKNETPHLQLVEKPNIVLASALHRTGAYILDIIIISVSSAVISAALLYTYKALTETMQLIPLNNRAPWEIDFLKQAVSLIVFTSYFTLSYWYTNGRSIGKKWLGLQVVSEDGIEFTFRRAFTRSLAYQVSYIILGLGFALAFIRDDKKCLHDLISKTKVISV